MTSSIVNVEKYSHESCQNGLENNGDTEGRDCRFNNRKKYIIVQKRKLAEGGGGGGLGFWLNLSPLYFLYMACIQMSVIKFILRKIGNTI